VKIILDNSSIYSTETKFHSPSLINAIATSHNMEMPFYEVTLKITCAHKFLERERDLPDKQELFQLLNTCSTKVHHLSNAPLRFELDQKR
jgi:hypothetical protein